MHVRRYQTEAGVDVFGSFMAKLKDHVGRAAIDRRVARAGSTGNFGDCAPVGHGVNEMKVDVGPGYRVYYAVVPVDTILLLRAGDKSTQGSDIPAAITALQNWQRRHP